jgi:hypothetical protein
VSSGCRAGDTVLAGASYSSGRLTAQMTGSVKMQCVMGQIRSSNGFSLAPPPPAAGLPTRRLLLPAAAAAAAVFGGSREAGFALGGVISADGGVINAEWGAAACVCCCRLCGS